MELLSITEPKTLEAIEGFISKIYESPGKSLLLPKGWVGARIGATHDTARLQLLVTWARHVKDGYIYFHVANSIEHILEEVGGYSPGIAALRLSNGVVVGEATIDRRTALTSASSKMEDTDKENFSKVIKGRTIDMICVSGSKVQFLRPLFYSRSEHAVRDKAGMQTLMGKLVVEINKLDRSLIPESMVKAFGVFANEIFQNTQQHAVTDCEGAPYTSHVEGLIVSWDQIDERLYASDFAGHPELSAFFERELRYSGRDIVKKSLRCFQLSFFDSGPGIASRASGLPPVQLDLAKERRELINSLKKNITTRESVGAGQGLPNVLAELRNIGGLMRIRSGRHCVFNAFSPGDRTADLFDFKDWSTKKLGPVEGTVISIVIPLRKG